MGRYEEIIARFDALTERPREVQAETLMRILAAARDSEFGRAHGFASIRSVEDYRRAVPLSTYEDLRPYIERDPAALTGERPLALLRTSASTGKPKRIPYTALFRDSIRAAHDVFTSGVLRDLPGLPLVEGQPPRGLGLYQLSGGDERFLDVPLDSYVSRLFDVALPEDPFFFALDPAVYRLADARQRILAMILAASGWDLLALRATNPTTLLLFARILGEETATVLETIRSGHASGAAASLGPLIDRYLVASPARAEQLAALGRPLGPRDLWPSLALLVTWRGGTSPLYEPYLRELYGQVRIRAPIFAASEGVVAISLADAMRGGVPALASSFHEFRPLGEEEDRTIGVEALEVGARYELILTSPTGMYRYRIQDIIEVDGRYHQTPTIFFVARLGRTSSVTGEKLTELQVEDAVTRAATTVGLTPVHYLCSAQVELRPYYVLSVEWGPEPPPPESAARLGALVDEELVRVNVEYAAKRESDRLGPVVVREVRSGEFERLQAAGLSGGAAANFKLPHLSAQPLHAELKTLR